MDIEKLYREYFTPVYRYTLSLVHDPDMAEEITQETFFRALKKINDYRGEASLKVWLCQIARNLSFDSLKRQSKTLALTKHDDDESDDYELPAGSESDPEEQLLRANSDEDPPHFARPERAVQRSLPAQDIRRPEFRRDRRAVR